MFLFFQRVPRLVARCVLGRRHRFTVLTSKVYEMCHVLVRTSDFLLRFASSFAVTMTANAKSLLSACADAHSFSLLEQSNTTEAMVVNALPYLAAKAKGDISMEGTHSAGSTLSQEAVQARPHKVSPELGERQATRCR